VIWQHDFRDTRFEIQNMVPRISVYKILDICERKFNHLLVSRISHIISCPASRLKSRP